MIIKHTKSHATLIIYFIVANMFMDLIFRYKTIQSFVGVDILTSFLFNAAIVLILYFIGSFFKRIPKLILLSIFLGLIAFIYASQLIYFQFFKTFYSAYSVGKGEQVFEFWQDVVGYIIQNAIWILLIFLPVLVLAIFGRVYIPLRKMDWLSKLVIVLVIVIAQFSVIGFIYLRGKEQHSAYDLYYNDNFPLGSVQKLGLLTSMRLDLQRQLTGWSPVALAPQAVEKTNVPEFEADDERTIIDDETGPENVVDIEEEVVPEYNVMEIDFDQLIAEESDEEMKKMHEYFKNVEPTAKNDYTGLYKGYNLIVLTAEGFSSFAVHEELTPTLYKMVNDGYRFDNFYTAIWEVSTSDGEYVALNSLIPKSGVWSFQQSANNYLPFALGNQLKKLDYRTTAYHNHSYRYYDRHLSHPNMGYDYKGLGNGLVVKETWPESDLEMMEVTVPEYINQEPFHTYYMTVSGHMQYSFTGNYIAWKNKQLVDVLDMSEQAKAYVATQIELDRALGKLLAELETAGVADHTLIALSADHYPYGLDDETIDEFFGHPVEKNFELFENNFILYAKGMASKTITKPASSLDILPTISNLLGLQYDSRLMMGRDIFSDSPPIVPFLNRSFITDKGMYKGDTKEFITVDGETVSDDYIEYMKSIVQSKFYYSAKILEKDYYRVVLKP